MSLNAEMLIDIAQTHGDSHIRPLEAELIGLKRQLMTDKQIVQEQSLLLNGKVEQFRPSQVCCNKFDVTLKFTAFSSIYKLHLAKHLQ